MEKWDDLLRWPSADEFLCFIPIKGLLRVIWIIQTCLSMVFGSEKPPCSQSLFQYVPMSTGEQSTFTNKTCHGIRMWSLARFNNSVCAIHSLSHLNILRVFLSCLLFVSLSYFNLCDTCFLFNNNSKRNCLVAKFKYSKSHPLLLCILTNFDQIF